MSLKQQVISGVGWVAVASVSKRILDFATTLVLARLLLPEEFGLVAMIAVFIGFAALFSELGLGAALIQQKDVEERHRSSVFWLNTVSGFALTGIIVASAPLIADFYQEPLLVPLTTLVAFNFSIGAFNDVQAALLRRNMAFKRLVLIDILSVIVAGTVAITLALMEFGVWSLVVRILAQTVTEVVAMWLTTSWKPKFIFEFKAIQELLGFSTNLLGFQVFNYWVRNADNLLIGRFVDPVSLGLYRQAYGVMVFPVNQITHILSTVMIPTLSRIQDDKQRIKAIILRSNRVLGLVTIPMMSGLIVVADSFVLTLFGPQWVDMAQILQILCLVAIVQPLVATMGWIFFSQGRTDIQFRWAIVRGVLTIGAFIGGVQWGVLGVAIAYAIRSYLLWYPGIAIPGNLIDMSFGEFFGNIVPILGCAVIMMLLVWGLGRALPENWPHWAYLTVQVSFGATVYGAAVHSFNLKAYRDARDLLADQWRTRRSASAESV